MLEINVGKDDISEKGFDVTCKDIVTVVSDVYNDTTIAEDDLNDALSLKGVKVKNIAGECKEKYSLDHLCFHWNFPDTWNCEIIQSFIYLLRFWLSELLAVCDDDTLERLLLHEDDLALLDHLHSANEEPVTGKQFYEHLFPEFH